MPFSNVRQLRDPMSSNSAKRRLARPGSEVSAEVSDWDSFLEQLPDGIPGISLSFLLLRASGPIR
jgi:hypothetical protein